MTINIVLDKISHRLNNTPSGSVFEISLLV